MQYLAKFCNATYAHTHMCNVRDPCPTCLLQNVNDDNKSIAHARKATMHCNICVPSHDLALRACATIMLDPHESDSNANNI